MTDKEKIKEFLTSLANDNYVEADKQFPEVVKSALQSAINNKKPAVVEKLNTEAEKTAAKALELYPSKPAPEENKK
jgi:Mg/Co/Ni transporter MgtE